jgi:hypothetical protein
MNAGIVTSVRDVSEIRDSGWLGLLASLRTFRSSRRPPVVHGLAPAGNLQRGTCMKRNKLIAVLAGATLLLAGCGSKSGTATVGTTTSSSAASSAMASVPAASSASASVESSAAESSSAASSAPESSGGPASSEATESSAAGTTIGNNSAGLDEASTKWFDTFCTGFGAFGDLQKTQSQLSGAAKDPKAAQVAIVTSFKKIGSVFSSTAASLKDLPPPTFNGGPEFAGKVVPVLAQFGSTLTDAANKAAAVDMTKDPSGLTTALSGVSSQMSSVTSAMGDLQKLKITPQTQAAIEAIPSCQKLKSLGG